MSNPETPTPLSNEAFDNGTLTDENDALAFSRSLEIKLTLATQRIKVMEGEREALRYEQEALRNGMLTIQDTAKGHGERPPVLWRVEEMLDELLSQTTFPRCYSEEEVRPVREAMKAAQSVIEWTLKHHEKIPASDDGTPSWYILDGMHTQLAVALSTLRAPQNKT